MTFNRREGKVSAPRSAYGTNQKPSYRKLDENSSKLAKRRKDVNKESVTLASIRFFCLKFRAKNSTLQAKQANHNRKAMSDKKHSKGMF